MVSKYKAVPKGLLFYFSCKEVKISGVACNMF
jgi:hypothetical protein